MLLVDPTLLSFSLISFLTSLYFSLLPKTSVAAFVRPSLAFGSIRMTSSYVSVTKSISYKEFFQSDIHFNEFFQAKKQ